MEFILYLVLSIIAISIIIVLILVPAVHFSKKMPAQLNNVHIGLSEAEFIEILGKPKIVEQIDAKTKMFFIAKLINAAFCCGHIIRTFIY